MQIQILTTSSPNNYLNKTIESIGTYDCVFKEDSSILNPTIIIENVSLSILKNANYCYIQTFGRYYYISNVEIMRGKIVKFTLRCDVLMSFKNDILSNNAIVLRQENNYNLYINDGSFMTYANNVNQFVKFPRGFGEEYSFIMGVIG